MYTLVLLMAVGRMSTLAEALIRDKSYPPDLPVSVVQDATCPG
jgi:siroheme synthase